MKTLEIFKKIINLNIFTSRARKVLALSAQEAMNLNHRQVGTAHLLLGILKEGFGVGASVLAHRSKVNISNIRSNLEQIPLEGGKSPEVEELIINPYLEASLKQALAEAKKLNHSYVGTEHLLLGLLNTEINGNGVNDVIQILKELDIAKQDIIDEVLDLIGLEKDLNAQNNLVIERNNDGILIFSADQVKELLGGEFPDSGTCPGYQVGFSFEQCEYHLEGSQLVPHTKGLPADGPNFQLTLVPRST